MTFVIALSVVSLLTAVIGCALIWGYDMRRAEEIERGFPPPQPRPELDTRSRAELGSPTRP